VITLKNFCTPLSSDFQAHQGFVLEKAHAIVQSIAREGATINSAICIENHIKDDYLNEALILLIGHISDLETFTESMLACAIMPTFDGHTL